MNVDFMMYETLRLESRQRTQELDRKRNARERRQLATRRRAQPLTISVRLRVAMGMVLIATGKKIKPQAT